MKVPEKDILEGNVVKVIFALGWPVMISTLLQVGYNMADTFWLGRWSSASNSVSAVAAMQLSWPIIFIMISVGAGFSVAGISLISQYTGANKIYKASESAGQLLSTAVIMAIILSLLGIFLAPLLVSIMGVEKTVATYTIDYMRIIFLGLPLGFISFIFMAVLRSYGDPVTPMIVDGIGVGLNIILDPILINGYFIFPSLGVVGAALATVITRSIASGIGIYILFRGVGELKIKLGYLKIKLSYLKKIFRIGLPASGGQISAALGFFILLWIIASLPNSTVALAAYGIGDRIINLAFIIVDGIGMGMATVVGHSIGANKFERAQETFSIGLKMSFTLLILETLAIIILRSQIVAFFIPESPEVIEEGSLFLLIFSIGIPFFGVFASVQGLYRGAGRTVPIMIMDIIRLWGFRVVFSFILGILLGLGSLGVWIGMSVSNIAAALVALMFYLSGSWRYRVID